MRIFCLDSRQFCFILQFLLNSACYAQKFKEILLDANEVLLNKILLASLINSSFDRNLRNFIALGSENLNKMLHYIGIVVDESGSKEMKCRQIGPSYPPNPRKLFAPAWDSDIETSKNGTGNPLTFRTPASIPIAIAIDSDIPIPPFPKAPFMLEAIAIDSLNDMSIPFPNPSWRAWRSPTGVELIEVMVKMMSRKG